MVPNDDTRTTGEISLKVFTLESSVKTTDRLGLAGTAVFFKQPLRGAAVVVGALVVGRTMLAGIGALGCALRTGIADRTGAGVVDVCDASALRLLHRKQTHALRQESTEDAILDRFEEEEEVEVLSATSALLFGERLGSFERKRERKDVEVAVDVGGGGGGTMTGLTMSFIIASLIPIRSQYDEKSEFH